MKNSKKTLFFFLLILTILHLTSIMFVKAQGTIIALTPSNYTAQNIGEQFSINITIENVQDLWSWKARITWDPNVLSLVSGPSEGAFLKSIGGTLFLANPPKNGTIQEVSCTLLSNTGKSGSGILATMMFQINKDDFLSPITLDNEVLLAPLTGGTHPKIDHQVGSATVTLGTQKGVRADAGVDQTVNEDALVTLNASRTLPQGQTLNFTWTFVDREPVKLEGMIVTHNFTIPGVYPVNLTVSDSEGRTSTDSIKITVKDITPPIAIIAIQGISPNQRIEVEQSILFNGSKSYDPKNGTITSYVWNLGEGMTYLSSAISYSYVKPGSYNISLTVSDYAGNTNTATVTITVAKANRPLSLFSDVTGLLIAVTAIVLIGLPSWIARARRRKQGM